MSDLRETSRVPSRLGGRLGAAALVLVTLAASALGEDPPSVWLADATGLMEVRRLDQAVVRDVAASTDARAVVLDRHLDLVWTVAGGTLRALLPDGEALVTVPLDLPPGAPVCLEVDEGDGSAWVGVGRTAQGYAYWGELQQRFTFDLPVLDLHVSPVDGRLWVVQPSAVLAIDRATGNEELRLDLPGVTSASVDPVTGRLWVAVAHELLRFSAGGVEELRLPRRGLTSLLAEGSGGVWGLRGSEVVRISEEGEEVSSQSPFALPQVPRRLRRDPATGSVWVASGRGLQRIAPSGQVQELLDLGEAADLRDLAPGRGPRDEEGPELQILSPVDGSHVRELRLEIRVTYSDDGAGVDAGTLAFQVNGRPLGVACRDDLAGATCVPETDLPEGTVHLVAWVEDFLENVGDASSVSFTVGEEDPDSDPGETPPEPGAEGPEGGGVRPAYYSPTPVDRGLKANNVYTSDGDIEAINTQSGNLTIAIPLGPTYSVGPKIRYGFRLVHNSSVWDDVGANCSPLGEDCPSPNNAGDVHYLISVPNADQNAGLGWGLHFGKLYAPTPPSGLTSLERQRWPNQLNSLTAAWLYVDPDGAPHQFHVLTNRPGTPGNTFYTVDGSFLRLQTNGSTQMKVEWPDGVVSYFEKVNDFAGTEFCGGGVNGCWRFSRMEDPYGNSVSVSYGVSGSWETWEVTDSARFEGNQQRKHYLRFRIDDGETGGGDGVVPLRTPDGHEWGDLRRILKQVDVQASDSQRLRYNLTHATQTVTRGKVKDVGRQYLPQPNLRTRILTAIRAGDGTGAEIPAYLGWNFGTDFGPGRAGCTGGWSEAGQLCEIRLPSRGKLRYTYQNWTYPTQCDYKEDEPSPIRTYTKPGVATKSRVLAGGSYDGTWTYDAILDGDAPWNGSHPDCSRETTRVTTVDGPVEGDRFTRRVFYHAMAVLPPTGTTSSTPITQWQGTEKGLPLTKDVVDDAPNHAGGDKLFLSRQVFHCPASGTCDDSNLERSTFVRYAMEWPGNCPFWLGDTDSCKGRNATLVAERTVYHDDERASQDAQYKDRFFLQQTGFGQARRVEVDPSFNTSGLSLPVEATEMDYVQGTTLGVNSSTGYYNLGSPSTWTPGTGQDWILGTSTETRNIRGGQTYATRTLYDAAGELVCQRRLKNPGSLSSKDVVTELQRGIDPTKNAGLVVGEIHAGGDDGQLSTSHLCSTVGSASAGTRHEVAHTYEAHQRETSEVVAPGSFPFLYQVEVDPWTGFVAAEYTISDQRTDLTYDPLGRLTDVTPEASLEEATTRLTYAATTGSNPTVTVERREGSTGLTWARTTYDNFGRPLFEHRRRPEPDGSIGTSMRRYDYYATGDLRYLTTWQDEATFNANLRTEYSRYDPQGRARYVQAPNQDTNTRQDFIYFGDRKLEVEEQIAALPDAVNWSKSVKRKTFYDGSGNVVRESTPLQLTEYTLDPAAAVIEAERSGQSREYVRDGRGFLLQEKHPELGSQNAPTGTIFYERDVLGNVRQKTGSGWNLDLDYDDAYRLVEVATGSQLWETFVYSAANNPSAGNYSKGKLAIASRYNYPLPLAGNPEVGDPAQPWMVRELYGYGGRLGQVSSKRTQLHYLANPPGQQIGVEFVQSWLYDSLGRVARTVYPVCDAAICNDGNDTPAPDHRADRTYVQTLTTKVTSDRGIGATYNYHDNFQPRENRYNSQLHYVTDRGTNGMTLPRRFRVRPSGSAVTKWDTGYYYYDGAQNIRRIGFVDHVYSYDDSQRLKSGQLRAPWDATSLPTLHTESYSYDAWDNLTLRNRDFGGAVSYEYTHTGYVHKNRLLKTPGHTGNPDIEYDLKGSVTKLGFIPGTTTPAEAISYDGLAMARRELIRTSTVSAREYNYLYGPGNHRFMRLERQTLPSVGSWEREHTVRDLNGKILRTWQGEGFGTAHEQHFQEDYVYGPEGLFASADAANTIHSYFKDHLGTPRLITEGQNEVGGYHNYYPYGDEIQHPSTTRDDRICKYTGHERDPHGRTDYMMARTYGYQIQRFLTVDPGRDGWNLYAYGANSPIKYVDPDGRAVETVWDVANIAVGTASLIQNLRAGNFKSALVDAGGLALDGAAAAVPFVPGGASTAIKTARLADKADDFLDAARASDEVAEGVGNVLFHYTDEVGARGIQESGVIKAGDQGRVYVTTDQIPASEASNALFMGRGGGKGSHVVEVRPNGEIPLHSGTQPNELIHQGSIRDGRQAFLEVKENDFK